MGQETESDFDLTGERSRALNEEIDQIIRGERAADAGIAEQLKMMAAEIERLKKLMEWRPIAEAEKSETPWLAGHSRYYLGYCPDDLIGNPAARMNIVWWEPPRGWVSDADVPVEPSHFLPLPSPPKETT